MQQQRLGHIRVVGVGVIAECPIGSLHVVRNWIRVLPGWPGCEYILCTYNSYSVSQWLICDYVELYFDGQTAHYKLVAKSPNIYM